MPSYAITGATILAGDELEPIPDATVIVEDGKIVAVGRSAEMSVPPNAEHVDARGCVLTPGFIDAHVHISFYDPHDVVAGGVTTVRDLGAPPQEIFELAARSKSSDFDGPTILAAGPMLTAPGGYPARAAWARAGTALELADPNEARAAVAALAARATIIKITLNPPVGPVLDDDTLRAIVDTAHDLGLRVTGHIWGLDQLRRALDAGIDELAHVLMSAEPIPDDVIARMTNASVAVVPTLSIRKGHDRDIAIDNVRRFRSTGGTILYGTD
ncbi:MAG TPA: amidohydrolase family protein, partial [Actinomycetota bacterium]|nr:amidohydrolase family protein [Actinomycetota bacterium]